MAQPLAHTLFWAGLWVYIRNFHVGGPTGNRDQSSASQGMFSALVLATFGIFFREDVIVFPIFMLLAAYSAGWLSKWIKFHGPVFCLWAFGYILLRIFLPSSSFLSQKNFYQMELSGILNWQGYETALRTVLKPLGHVFPSHYSSAQFIQLYQTHPLHASAWLAAIILLGLALGWTAWKANLEHCGMNCNYLQNAKRIALFSLGGFFIGLLPYAAFKGALIARDAHRFSLALGALSLGLGCSIHFLAGLISRINRTALLVACLCVSPAFLFGIATRFWFPDPSARPFGHLEMMYETRQTIHSVKEATRGSIKEGDEFLFFGFPWYYRIPKLFKALEPRRIKSKLCDDETAPRPNGKPSSQWIIRRTVSNGNTILSIRKPPGGETKKYSWPRKPKLRR